MIISIYANKLGLSIRGSKILWKWLWLESLIVTRVESFCEKRDSSRVTIFLNVTRVASELPKIVTRITPSLVGTLLQFTKLQLYPISQTFMPLFMLFHVFHYELRKS